MSSSYVDRSRIAYDKVTDGAYRDGELAEIISKIKSLCNYDVPLSTHSIETPNESWQSVVDHDAFFETVMPIPSVEEFSAKIKQNLDITGLDVAKYILSHIKCTHLKLEKLVYLCYADYLCFYGKRLFIDDIYAFKYGPVIKTVYEKYKGNGSSVLDDEQVFTQIGELPATGRILFSKDGIEKMESIRSTLFRYSKFSSTELVDITHRQGSPWAKTYIDGSNEKIIDAVILKNHTVEQE